MRWVRSSADPVAGKKQHGEAAFAAKVELRDNVMHALGPDRCRVFDAFCGDGGMHREAWQYAASYIGCDLRFWPPAPTDVRARFVADNLRVLRAIDLSPFNVFDLDAYGSPWTQMLILAARRKWQPGECGAVVLTDGSPQFSKFGRLPHDLAELCSLPITSAPSAKTGRWASDLAISKWLKRCGLRETHRWQAEGKTACRVIYTAVVFEAMAAPNSGSIPPVADRCA